MCSVRRCVNSLFGLSSSLIHAWRIRLPSVCQCRSLGHHCAQVYAKLTGVHKGAVTALLPMGSLEPGGPDRLISAGIDGTVAVSHAEDRSA